jgi:thioredoxin-related protein
MNFLLRHKKFISIILFIAILIISLYFIINMITNKSLEKYSNNNKKSNVNDKIFYYFYFASCPYCVKFMKDANGWNAIKNYAEKKGIKVVKKDIHANSLTKVEKEYVDNNLKTVPHLAMYNKKSKKWYKYEGDRNLKSLQTFVNKK